MNKDAKLYIFSKNLINQCLKDGNFPGKLIESRIGMFVYKTCKMVDFSRIRPLLLYGVRRVATWE